MATLRTALSECLTSWLGHPEPVYEVTAADLTELLQRCRCGTSATQQLGQRDSTSFLYRASIEANNDWRPKHETEIGALETILDPVKFGINLQAGQPTITILHRAARDEGEELEAMHASSVFAVIATHAI